MQVTALSVRHPEQDAAGAVMPFMSEPQESHTAIASVACDHTGQPCQEREGTTRILAGRGLGASS